MVKVSAIFALLIFGLPQCIGQTILKGRVVNQESEAVPGALIKLYGEDTVSLRSYTTSDTHGNWQMPDKAPGAYMLVVASLGYEPLYEKITLPQQDSFHVYTLLPQVQQIGLIEISADKVGLIVRGDTTFYNIGTFTDSTEYNLSDVLNKLPQVSVDENGTIRYKGRRVDVALINGKDIFGQMHKQMTESIKAEDIESVQIISNYKEGMDVLSSAHRENVALNVALKPDVGKKIKSDIGINSNLNQYHELDGTAYKVNSRGGFTTLIRGNTTAQATLSPSDLFALVDIEDLQKSYDAQAFEKYAYLFVPIIDIKRNSDWLGFNRIVGEYSKHWTWKTSVLYTNFSRSSERASFRVYTNSNSVFSGVKRQFKPSQLLQVATQQLYHKNKTWLEFKPSFSCNYTGQNNRLEGMLDSNGIQTEYRASDQSFGFAQVLSAGYQLDSLQSILFQGKMNFSNDRESNELDSELPLFNLSNTLSQPVHTQTLFADISLTYKTTWFGHEVKGSGGLQYHKFEYNLETIPSTGGFWENTTSVTDKSHFYLISLAKRSNAFRYSVEAGPKMIYRSYGTEQPDTHFTTWTGQAGVYYDLNKNHSLYFTFNLNTDLPQVRNLLRVRQIISENTLRIENVDSNYIYQNKNLQLNYSNRTSSGQWDYFCRLQHLWSLNEVQYRTVVENSTLINYSFLSPKVQRTIFESGGKYIIKEWKTAVCFNSAIEFSDEYAMSGAQLFRSDGSRISTDLGLRCSLLRILSLNAGFKCNYSKRTYADMGLNSKFWNVTYSFNTQYKYKNWQFSASFEYQKQSSSVIANKLFLVSFRGEYRLPNLPLRLKIIGRNILNLSGTQIIFPDFDPNYLGFDTFQTIGGQILGGVSYVF